MSRFDPHKLLNQLEPVTPPRDAWPAILAELNQPKRSSRPALAIAASLFLLISTAAFWSFKENSMQQEIEQWMQYSLYLESQLERIEAQASLLRGHQGVALAELKNQLLFVDYQLSQSPQDEQNIGLWQHRALLLNDLLNIRVSNANPMLRQAPVNTWAQPATLTNYEI